MIVLTVLSYSGQPTEGLSASFDELGGSIGRAEGNQLVLPDPERSISRLHAKVLFRSGQYTIVDNGSNPIAVNGSDVPSGREHPLQAGDQVQIGGYLLKVAQAAAASAAAAGAFDDLFGDGAQGLAGPALAPKLSATPWTAPPTSPTAAAWGGPPPAPAWPAPAPQPIAAPPRSPVAPSALLDDDWDFLAPDPKPGNDALALAPSSSIGSAIGPGAMDSLDDLFGLGGPSGSADPLGATPQQAMLMQPNMAAHADPLKSLDRPAGFAQASRSDHVSELNTPMSLPRAPAPLEAPVAAAPAAPSKPPTGLPTGAIFSWDDPPRDGRVVTLPGRARGDGVADEVLPAVATATPTPTPAPAHATQAAPLPAPAPPPTQAVASATPDIPAVPRTASNDAALIAALLQGLGAPGVRIESLSPELMLLIGQLLRESTRGAVELLLARTALKREMRAQVTMIVARENNPLKFSPSVEMALQHLLSPTTPGFMPAASAVRDAFNDLRAHQLGVMAGMKAALDGVLQRFDPQQLEAQLSSRSTLSNLIPSSRKAKLWELFQQLFGQLSSEAQDDFDELFGKAFLRAYEAQLDRLQTEPGQR